jgi:hypothetical protein
LCDEGYLLKEIAELLNLDRTTLRKAINYDRARRGLPPFDVRVRRKSLPRKNRPKPDEAA